MPQPEFSPATIQVWEMRWGKLNSKPDMPTYTSRLQALRGLKEIECPEPFEGFLVLLFDNEADANVAALLLKEFILRSDDGSTLPSTVEGPRLRAPPPPPITPPTHPADGKDDGKGEWATTPKRKRDDSGEASATDPKILAVEREQRAQAQRLIATNARLDQWDEKITDNSKAVGDITTNVAHLVGCSILGRGAEPPQFWVLLIWLEPGISHVTWVHYDATMCLPCFVCSILPVLHFLRFDLCVL